MSFPPAGPGKTAPKIYDDFLIFDPLKASANFSVLASHVSPVGEGPRHGPGIGSCRHDYTTKHAQSVTPPLDLRPDGTTKYRLATVCKKCRIHANIRIDYDRATNPCPNSEYPLHHFQRLEAEDATSQDRISYAWQCSAPQCQAHLEISYRQPRLSPSDISLLTDTEKLKRRYEAVVQQDPSRDGLRQAIPMEALSRLRKYTKDTLNPNHTKRAFPANNKRFMEAFGVEGQDCKELLQRLGFVYADEAEWRLPSPPTIDNRLQADGSSLREYLEDVESELVALMFRIASETGSVNPAATDGWPSANRDVERVLAAQGYQRHVSMRRAPASNEELPYFASLGALADFADTLVIFAYDRQSNCDPERPAYYLECLQVITEGRGTEELQTKVVMLQSEDNVSRRDLSAAYRYLTIENGHNATEEQVLNVFQARQQSLGQAAAEDNRSALYKIGVSRGSQRLMAASRQSVDTYEEALDWLGAGKEVADDFLLSLAAIKEENHSDKETARKAISTIARARKSDTLNAWLTTGRTEGTEMSVDEALRLLNINEKLEDLTDATGVAYLFEFARKDRPGQQTEKAIYTIERALRGKDTSVIQTPESWPVGLQSHGNTCYLNSLLQYYFAFKPFRDIMLDYEQYRLDLSKHSEKEERVGQRKISLVEIKGGQRFAKDLQELFKRMIKAHGPAVRPDADLVCRAFLEPKDYALLASSVLDGETAANGIEGAADVKLPDADTVTPELTSDGDVVKSRKESNASSVTLQASVNGDGEDVAMNVDGPPPPTPPHSPSQKASESRQQPAHAPPLPPRRFSTTEDVREAQKKALREAEAKAKEQQDVTEVHDSVMFRLRAGMQPQGVDATGEQQDALREYYTIALTETRLDEKGSASKAKTTLLDSSIQLNVPYEPTDIYSALDDVFDLQQYGEGSSIETYKTVQKLPQILQISVPRIGYDKVKGAYKTDSTVRLEDELFMDRYCDASHADVLPSRKRSWGWRKQMRELKKEQKALKETTMDLDGPAAIAETAKYLDDLQSIDETLKEVDMEGLDMDEDLALTLATAAQQQKDRLAELDKGIGDLQNQLDAQFKDLKALKYRLAAVFFHRGSHGGGHYWVCIHDFATDIWRKYNDEVVDKMPKSKLHEIFQASKWDHGTPTYLVYVKDEQKDELVQPVCRDPEKAPEPEPWPSANEPWPATNDVQMLDGETVKPQREVQQWNTIDPKMTQEGGEASWDQARQVAQGEW